MTKKTIRVPVLLGPTAVGKTDAAVEVARALDVDIISCDSRQIYKGMNIGTAKPSAESLKGVVTRLIDIVNPSEYYSAFQFAVDAAAIIRENHTAGKGSLVCGGTGLYFQALSQGLGAQAPSDESVRAMLHKRAAAEGLTALYNDLSGIDPHAAGRIHPNDAQRVIRALEVHTITGIPISVLQRRTTPPDDLLFYCIVLERPREELHTRIDSRVDAMMKEGLWDEFIALLNSGYDEHTPGLLCPGYREFFEVIQNGATLADATDRVKYNTKRFAKRQLTWLRHQLGSDAHTLPAVDYLSIEKQYREFLLR